MKQARMNESKQVTMQQEPRPKRWTTMFYLEHSVLEILFPYASGTNHGKAGLHEENHTPRENHQPLVQVRLAGHIFRLKGLKVLTDADQRVRIYLAAFSDGAGLV
jgi:hypothetical protein